MASDIRIRMLHAKISMIAGAGVATQLYWLWADSINADPKPERTRRHWYGPHVRHSCAAARLAMRTLTSDLLSGSPLTMPQSANAIMLCFCHAIPKAASLTLCFGRQFALDQRCGPVSPLPVEQIAHSDARNIDAVVRRIVDI